MFGSLQQNEEYMTAKVNIESADLHVIQSVTLELFSSVDVV